MQGPWDHAFAYMKYVVEFCSTYARLLSTESQYVVAEEIHQWDPVFGLGERQRHCS